MQPHQNLPFKVGQLAELKSFETGYRGAWFRCKIHGISNQEGHIQHYLEFYDYQDEQMQWTTLYQKQENERDMHLMIRPSFPSIYCESQMQDPRAASDVIVVVDDAWKVGDLVDWWTTSCYWCGRITQLLGEDKVEIKLHDPPLGEGLCYEASCKDLRPSLDWSPEGGWTLPISLGDEACRSCVHLIQPTSQETTGFDKNPPEGGSSFEFTATNDVSSQGLSATSPSPQTSTDPPEGTPKNSSDNEMNARDFLNSSLPDTLEKSILDLEELVNKVKWLKRVHQYGIRYANSMTPAWKFLEDH